MLDIRKILNSSSNITHSVEGLITLGLAGTVGITVVVGVDPKNGTSALINFK